MNHPDPFPFLQRSRRLRGNSLLRQMVRETRLSKSALIAPLFVQEGVGIRQEIPSMEGQYRYSPDQLLYELETLSKTGIQQVLLFGIPNQKDACGSQAWSEQGVVQTALRLAKQEFPNLFYITDVCLCEYTSHGHCGILSGNTVDNDETLPLLAKTALSHVQAGADMVAPSDMMDGRILAIRQALDQHGFSSSPILSYAVKYASAFYGPFREAADSAPAFGDRKSYQMDYHNRREGVKKAQQDLEQGADLLMVKPALSYLDVLYEVSSRFPVPTVAYSVSGEYSMIKAAAKLGWMDEVNAICETAVSIFRAGASALITYYAKELAQFIEEGRIG